MRADLALIGFGNVGRRFARLLGERSARLAADYDLTCRIAGIATARHGVAWDADGIDAETAIARVERGESISADRTPSAPVTSFDIIERLARSDAELRVVVETTTLDIAAGQPAIDHVRAAFAAGCHVVTANKGPAAFAFASLRAAAGAAGVSFLFEGAVMDGIPVFNLVRETLPAVEIVGFRGIVNSTTNHILSALEDGEAFAPALARMQAEGIAESDPSLDVDGWDAAAKTAALANVLMDAELTPHDVRRTGIGEQTGDAARHAKAARTPPAARGLGVARSRTAPSTRRSRRSSSPLTICWPGVRGQANALVLSTDLLGEIAIGQLDGGLTHTAYALLSDLVTIRRRQ